MADELIRIGLQIDDKGGVRKLKDVERGLTKLDKGAKDLTANLKKFGLALAAVGAATAGIIAVGRRVFELGASVEETGSKFRRVFGSATKDVEAFGRSFATMAGLSGREFQEMIATTGAMSQGMGFAQMASAEFAQEVVKLSADIASFNNLPTEDVIQRINAALTGERESLKRLGIVILETDVQQRALNNTGKDSVRQLTQQEKATATLELITLKAGKAVGDLALTSGSAANQAKALGAEFRNTGEILSTEVLPIMQEMLPIMRELTRSIGVFAADLLRASITLARIKLGVPGLAAGALGAQPTLARLPFINAAQTQPVTGPQGFGPITSPLLPYSGRAGPLPGAIPIGRGAGARVSYGEFRQGGYAGDWSRNMMQIFEPLKLSTVQMATIQNQASLDLQRLGVAALGAASGLVQVIKAGGNAGGILGGILSLAGGVVGVVNPLIGAGLMAGGGLLSGLTSTNRRPTPVTVESYGQRALSQQRDEEQVINFQFTLEQGGVEIKRIAQQLRRLAAKDGSYRTTALLGAGI